MHKCILISLSLFSFFRPVFRFFLLEIVVHFLTGIDHGREYTSSLKVQESQNVKNVPLHVMVLFHLFSEFPQAVGKLYLQGGFIIDLTSGVPISFLEFFLAPDMSCEELEESGLNKGIVPYLRYFSICLICGSVCLKMHTSNAHIHSQPRTCRRSTVSFSTVDVMSHFLDMYCIISFTSLSLLLC